MTQQLQKYEYLNYNQLYDSTFKLEYRNRQGGRGSKFKN